MQVTLFSFAMTILWSGILAILVHFCRKKPRLVQKIGTKKLLFLCLFSMARMMLPYEFSFARAFPFLGVFQFLEDRALGGIGKSVSIHKAEIGLPFSWLALVWAGVSAALLLRFFCRYIKSLRECAKYGVCGEGPCQAVFRQILNESGSQMEITIRHSEYVSVPMGVGIFKKSILLPEKAYSSLELYYILLHEFTHFKNRDLLVKAMVHIFSCVYWWNPAVYLLRKDLSQILELQCDLDVTKGLPSCDKANYLAVIVSVLKSAGAKKRGKTIYGAAALVAGSYGAETVERFQVVSMDSVGSGRKKLATAAWCLSVALLFGLSYSFTALPGPKEPRATHGAEAGQEAYGLMEEDSFVDIMKNTESPYMYLRGSHVR